MTPTHLERLEAESSNVRRTRERCGVGCFGQFSLHQRSPGAVSSERRARADDFDSSCPMEQRKRKGYI